MKSSLFVLFLLFSKTFIVAQNAFVGTYTGTINGDNVVLTMQPAASNQLVGKMKDSQQSYEVNAQTNGSKLTGTAVEKTMNLTFFLNGTLNNNHILMDLTIEVLGQKQAMQVDFVKQGASSTAINTEQTPLQRSPDGQYSKPTTPAGGKIDPNLVGKWVNESNYSSGYGDNAFSGSTSQSMILFADGTLSDGGSSARVSGSNYSGNSSGGGASAVLPNVIWYAQNQHLFIVASQNGQTQTVDLGKYYIENGAMLITGNNGKKLLFHKRG